MPVDNELYNTLSDSWWDENTALGILRSWYGPVRFGYFQRIIAAHAASIANAATLLDVGCGGGLLAEEFARLGYQVTGLDPSAASLATARAHMRQTGVSINYQQGIGEHLPFANASFSMVTCCDVLEHVDDLDAVIAEISRVLVPGGLFFFDTINRNPLTWFAHIKLAQDWPMTSFMPKDLHDWHKFITPAELKCHLSAHDLRCEGMRGMLPRLNPLSTVALFLAQKRGTITLDEMGKRMHFQEGRGLAQSYMGYARRL